MNDILGTSLQENILTLACFDEQRASTIRNTIDISLYTDHYRHLATEIYSYIDSFDEPPGKHISDLLEDKIESDNKRESKIYSDLLIYLYEASESLNPEYVMVQLEKFIRRQTLRAKTAEIVIELQKDTDDGIDNAESLFRESQITGLKLFEPGIFLNDTSQALNFLDHMDDSFKTGIPALDRRNLGPTRKTLHLYIARYKTGKTWWLTKLAKIALLNRLKVCHITLEVSADIMAQRYMQAFFAVGKRKEKYQYFKFEKKGEIFRDIVPVEDWVRKGQSTLPETTFQDDDIREVLTDRIEEFSDRYLKNIVIKEFPTGRLTIKGLESYLDNLETICHFVPDMVIVDYPDLMEMDKANLRGSLDEIYKTFRGNAVERNQAWVVVSQSHRPAAKAKTTGGDSVSEHYGKVAHADTIITYSQTDLEKTLQLGRLYVAGARNDQDGITIIVSHELNIGQFIIDSALMVRQKDYWNIIREETGDVVQESD